jgi:chromosomal replication initiator protein
MVLEALKKSLSPSIYKAWFASVEFCDIQNNGRKMVVQVHSTFQKNYIEKKHKTILLDCISQYYPKIIHIDYFVKPESEEHDLMSPLARQPVLASGGLHHSDLQESQNMKLIADYLPKRNINNLNPKYTLEQFVITSGNELAVSVSKAIIAQPGQAYNPVFLHSDVGLGKTHLIQAIGQKLIEQQPNLRVRYCTLETFFSHYISSVQKNRVNDFKAYYRELDVLLIDDIQFLKGKEGTQDAFFHTFNELYQLNKQIVLTSDKPPKFLSGVEERLISRFESGITIDIQKPDFEGRVAILKSKVEQLRIQIDPVHIATIAGKVTTNIRDLEGVVNRIQARTNLLPDKHITDSELTKILNQSDLTGTINLSISNNRSFGVRNSSSNAFNIETAITKVAREFGISYADILGNSKQKEVVYARQLAMWIFKNHKKVAVGDIARIFGRSHSTIIHACKKVDQLHIEQTVLDRVSSLL